MTRWVQWVGASVRWKKTRCVISELAIASVSKTSMASAVIDAKMVSSIYSKTIPSVVKVSSTASDCDRDCDLYTGLHNMADPRNIASRKILKFAEEIKLDKQLNLKSLKKKQ